MVARELMNADVVSARTDMTVHNLVMLLKTNRISGVPVLDVDDQLVGVVSTSDIIMTDDAFGDAPGGESDYHTQLATVGVEDLDAVEVDETGNTLVSDIMSVGVIAAAVDAPVQELADLMYSHHIHRVVITDGGRLAGIVGTMDILKAVIDGKLS